MSSTTRLSLTATPTASIATATLTESHPANGLIRLRSPKPTSEVDWSDPLNKGLVAWYKFKEYPGSALFPDLTGNNDGQQTAIQANQWERFEGKLGFRAVPFGANDAVTVPIDPAELGVMSASFWARSFSGSAASGHGYFWGTLDAGGYFALRQSGDTGLKIYTGGATTTFSSCLENDTWHHVYISADPSARKLYIDGKLFGSTTGFTGSYTQSDNMAIGDAIYTSTGNLSAWKCKTWQRDHRFYNRVLQSSEVHDLYVASRTGYVNQYKRRSFPVGVTEAPETPEAILRPAFAQFVF